MLFASIHTTLHVGVWVLAGGGLSECTVLYVRVWCLSVYSPAQRAEVKQYCMSYVPYLHTSCRWPHPDWQIPTPAAGHDSRRSSCWPRWTRSSPPLHSRRVSQQSILGPLQSTPPSPVPTRPWSCNNWFFFFFFAPPPQKHMPHCYWFDLREQLNSIVSRGRVTEVCSIWSNFFSFFGGGGWVAESVCVIAIDLVKLIGGCGGGGDAAGKSICLTLHR